MSSPYTGSAGSRRLLQIILLLLSGLPLVVGQVSDLCPHRVHGIYDYENPLNDDWLSAYDVKSYDLALTVSNENTLIDGFALILVEATRSLDTLVFELQDGLEVSAVSLDDKQLYFEHVSDAIYIKLERSYEEGEMIQVAVYYSGDAGQDRGFFAGVSSRTDYKYGFDVTYTLSEPMNAFDWFPVKQVLEDKIDSVTFRITCGPGLLAGSNGILVDVSEDNGSHTYTWKTSYPMAYYLLSFAVADYRDFSFYAPLSDENDSVLVQNFIYNSDEVFDDLHEEILMTAPLMSSFSQLLIDYPFSGEKYGHCMAPMGGGMEHQTMTTIQDFDFFLVAHELAHQWFGDHVTCGNWQDIWINEGFASYMEFIAAQESLGQEKADEWMNNAMSIALRETTGSVYVPEEDVEDTYRLFDSGLTYKKGAILLHTIRFILDDDPLFFLVLQSYLEQFGSGLALGSDFQAILEAESGQDFSPFFQQWYYGEGYPRFNIYWKQMGDTLHIRSEQSTTDPQVTPLFQVPFELEMVLSGGERKRIRLNQNNEQEEYLLAMEGRVMDLIFDPDNYLLATSSVIQEVPAGKAYRYGPNPVYGDLFLQFYNAGSFEKVRITNTAGQVMLNITQLENPAIIDLSLFFDGTYFLEFTNSYGTFSEQILKLTSE